MPIKYYQNISKGVKVIERKSFCRRTDGRQADRYIPEPCRSGIKSIMIQIFPCAFTDSLELQMYSVGVVVTKTTHFWWVWARRGGGLGIESRANSFCQVHVLMDVSLSHLRRNRVPFSGWYTPRHSGLISIMFLFKERAVFL